MSLTTIVSEGNLIPADLLAQIAAGEAEGQQPADFGFEKARRLTDEIAAAWADVRVYWEAFQRSLRRLRDDDPATTVTRERWVVPLLETLGYKLTYIPAAATVGGRSYAISHRAGEGEGAPPVHIEGVRRSLDQRGPAGRPRLSPHALVQEYLNGTEQLWGLVTNGERLRLLRDSSRTVRPVYVEFDLRAMLEGEKFSEFALFYRLLHRTRLPQSADDAPRCLLERYHQQAIEAGGRVRDGLRDGVDLALRALGAGLLQHPGSTTLRAKLAGANGNAGPSLHALDYYRQLLRLVYRLLFLMVAEERKLVGMKDEGRGKKQTGAPQPASLSPHPLYYRHYSVSRLRRLAERPTAASARHSDLWLGLLASFRLLEDDEAAQVLGVAALDGDLFGPQAMPDLAGASLDNATLLRAIRALSLYRDPKSKTLRRVNYAALDVEELGSVYESLLDYRPVVRDEGRGMKDEGRGMKDEGRRMKDEGGATPSSAASSLIPHPSSFDLVAGTERKTTGSYYTRPELVHELIKSALEPVLAARVKEAETGPRWRRQGADDLPEPDRALPPDAQAKVRAILALRVVDPAAGSGHFLLAAARRLGRELARVRSGEDQPAPTEFRRAVRDVIARCIYAVDLNPLAVDLCKVALWLESLEPGKPLSFLDSKVRWGNSLVGATRALVAHGIPDDAFKPVTGDDKAAASAFRKRNKKEREAKQRGQLSLGLEFAAPTTAASPSAAARALNAMPDDSVAAVRAKARQYEQLRAGAYSDIVRFNLWTAAFFTPLADADDVAVPTSASLDEWNEKPVLFNLMLKSAFELAQQVGFFHWELEFPDIFPEGEDGGFDVVLGNPPWEMLQLDPQEFFIGKSQEIVKAANMAARDRLIVALKQSDRQLYEDYYREKHRVESLQRFVHESSCFPLTSFGRINLMALFTEWARGAIAPSGRAGLIVPTGIATDSFNQYFFSDLVAKQQLVSLYDFENRDAIFPGVHRSYKFCLLTVGATKVPTQFVFFAARTDHIYDVQRAFSLTPIEIALINPNTRTAPVFRTHQDAELTKKIYRHTPVLLNESISANSWNVSFQLMFMMNTDSYRFEREPKDGLLPLYEAKLMHQFTHRWATYEGEAARDLVESELSNPSVSITPHYWVSADAVTNRLSGLWDRSWLLGFRDIARSTDERTAIFSLMPRAGVGNKIPLVFSDTSTIQIAGLLATLNSLTFDFVTRQKVGGTSLNFYICLLYTSDAADE